VLFVTHDQIEALSLSDRIAVMQRGRIEQVGAPRSLYDRPASAFVRDFLGQTVVLRGRVAGGDAAAVTVKMEGALAGRILVGRAAADTALGEGVEAQLAIRPEDIAVSAEESRSDDHTRPGVIEALLFVGDRYEARVALGGEQRILLLLPRGREWREGQRLQLGFPADVVSVWPTS
jgi:ABC-type Fe3+/spermidine/putrescine transport system ATPase subunit